MPVYLVACSLKAESGASSFLKRWIRYIKGPVDHVELSFVEEGRETYGFNITLQSKTPKFCSRDYSTIDKFYDVTWYELGGIDAVECERYCETQHGKGVMSVPAMMRSAMPFDGEAAAMAAADFVETRAVPRSLFAERAEGVTEEFCASATLKALKASCKVLGDVDPYKCTAFDVVVLAKTRLGAKESSRPTFVRTVDPEIPRSEDWY